MLERVQRMLAAITWRRADAARFLGEFLTEPKPQVWFERPPRPLQLATFASRARIRGVRLALQTRMLFDERHLFVNGERMRMPSQARGVLRQLAGRRELSPWPQSADVICGILHDWYKCGYVELA
jgi:50S ribosomal protein L16 3-hydroxylase